MKRIEGLSLALRGSAQDTIYFFPTADEFRALVKVREELARLPGDKEPKQMSKALREALGEERFEQYERATDYTYRLAREAAERYGVPAEAADDAWKVKQNTDAMAKQIRADPALSVQERHLQLEKLRRGAEDMIAQKLGVAGAKMAASGLAWLDMLPGGGE